jgi:hypothetical protein
MKTKTNVPMNSAAYFFHTFSLTSVVLGLAISVLASPILQTSDFHANQGSGFYLKPYNTFHREKSAP